ncbi:hypothetical protein D7Z26_15220 [Cohnella endophytica]|uniref:Uncharacterized protein n=1 Tax=Cohnella endophytica TaxID=2419778 RepID=A0A494XTE7_9BACL|nr:hypothetical protein D7Z26_15220 [Cohnella endophytica]
MYQGEAWKPKPGADGFALALENESYALYIRPDDTQIAVVNKRNGYRWTSNPTEEQLKEEKTKGLPLQNLKSPFALVFVMTQGKDQTIRDTLNVSSPKMEVAMIKNDKGVQISYWFPEKKIGLAIQYELTTQGLKVRVPTDGIREEGEFVVFTLDLLPYFGAATSKEDGYLFVPDGPGGLIRFDSEQADISRGYNHEVYGSEITNMANYTRSGERREDIAYPVFGVKKGDNAYVAVLTQGGDSANISAMPPGLKTSFYNVNSNQIYREEYLYQVSRLSTPTKANQKQRLDRDREVEYRFLTGEDAGYVGMAKSYREYLKANGQLTQTLKPVSHAPMYLKIFGGNFREAYNRIQYVTATTFPQATEIVKSLKDKGMTNAKVIYYGWQDQGDYNMEKRFPIEKSLGGDSEAKKFVSEMKKENIDVIFQDDFSWIDSASASSGKNNAIRGIDGTAFDGYGWYMAKPEKTVREAYDTIDKLKDIGVAGIHYNMLGEVPFNDYDPSGIRTREYTIDAYKGLLDYTRKQLGSASVYRGNAYAVGSVDYIDYFPNESSYDFMIGETVPFYPIVLHGYVPYSFDEGNLRNNVEDEFLKAIEYGAIPTYFLTYKDSRDLKYVASWLFSSQYEKWADRLVKEYKDFDALSGLFSQTIVNHEKLTANRFVTTYEDGTKVIVDYGNKSFKVEKGGGA